MVLFSEPPLATLHELSTVYSFDDLLDFHDAIDVILELREPAPGVKR